MPLAPASVLSTTAISDEGCGHGGELDRGDGSTCATGASYGYLGEQGGIGSGKKELQEELRGVLEKFATSAA